MEIGEEGHLPFLDIDIYKKMDGFLGHRVYRKSMMSFVNMFSPTCYTLNDIRPVRIFRGHFGEYRACGRLE